MGGCWASYSGGSGITLRRDMEFKNYVLTHFHNTWNKAPHPDEGHVLECLRAYYQENNERLGPYEEFLKVRNSRKKAPSPRSCPDCRVTIPESVSEGFKMFAAILPAMVGGGCE